MIRMVRYKSKTFDFDVVKFDKLELDQQGLDFSFLNIYFLRNLLKYSYLKNKYKNTILFIIFFYTELVFQK